MCVKGRLKGLLLAFFCAVLFGAFSPLNADEFIFWAKLGNENLILNHQSIYISSAMSPKNEASSGFGGENSRLNSSENGGFSKNGDSENLHLNSSKNGDDKNSRKNGVNLNENSRQGGEILRQSGRNSQQNGETLRQSGVNFGENGEKNLIFVCELAYTQNDFESLPKGALGLVDEEMPKRAKLNFLNAHKDELLECFLGENVEVKDFYKEELAPNSLNIANQAGKENAHKTIKNQTQIKILPIRFTINFATQKAIIYKIP